MTKLRYVGRGLEFLDLSRKLQCLDEKSRAEMQRNVTMERPNTWIVEAPLQDDVRQAGGQVRTRSRQNLHITALRVLRIDRRTIPFADALSQYVVVVSVHVHSVGAENVVHIHSQSKRRVGAEVVDVAVVRKREVPLENLKQSSVVVVCAECDVVDVPYPVGAI